MKYHDVPLNEAVNNLNVTKLNVFINIERSFHFGFLD